MDNQIRQQAVLLFGEYNRVLGEVYDELLEGVSNETTLASSEFQDYLQNSVVNSLQPWFVTELEGLSEGTPEVFFDSLLKIEDVMTVFTIAAEMLDGDLPDLLMLRVGAFGEASSDRLVEMALAHDWAPAEGEDDDAFRKKLAVSLAALRVLGQWTYEPAIEPVLNRFCALSEPDEYVADGIKAFVVPFAEKIVPELSARIEGGAGAGLKGPFEYLVIYLTEIGRAEPDEEIFQCLKKAFRNMEHKVIAAICLGDYGDGRAVPLLKSYLDRHVREIDRQFFYETISAIKRLGGDISDIQDPFRDFSAKK
ncbi:MAG: hypothetical protein WCG21_11695 [Eubacteriales bacterium]